MIKVVHINSDKGKVSISKPVKDTVKIGLDKIDIYVNHKELLQALILASIEQPYPSKSK